MTTPMMRLLTLVTMLVLPGGLVALAAWLFARAVVAHMRQGQQFPRAVASVRLRDVWNDARRSLK